MFDFIYQFLEKVGYIHPLHPTQVSMPIGLVVAAFVMLLIALIIRSSGMARVARYCIVAAILFLIPTVIAGFMDWQHYFSGGWISLIKMKMILAVLLFVLLLAAVFLDRKNTNPSPLLLMVYGLCLATVAVLGYLGAELVFAGRTPEASSEFTAARVLFRSHCSGCHPYGSNIVKAEHILWKSPKLASEVSLKEWLHEPDAPMPGFFPARLSDKDVQDLFAYLNVVFYKQTATVHSEEEHEHD